MKILLVEDSRILRDRLRAIIATIPLAALVAETDSEYEARRLLDLHRPQVAVIDLRLRCGSGLALIEHIAAVHRATTMIALTNSAQEEYREKCKALGAHYFFDKSKGIEAFTLLLTELGRRRAEQPAACRSEAT